MLFFKRIIYFLSNFDVKHQNYLENRWLLQKHTKKDFILQHSLVLAHNYDNLRGTKHSQITGAHKMQFIKD